MALLKHGVTGGLVMGFSRTGGPRILRYAICNGTVYSYFNAAKISVAIRFASDADPVPATVTMESLEVESHRTRIA